MAVPFAFFYECGHFDEMLELEYIIEFTDYILRRMEIAARNLEELKKPKGERNLQTEHPEYIAHLRGLKLSDILKYETNELFKNILNWRESESTNEARNRAHRIKRKAYRETLLAIVTGSGLQSNFLNQFHDFLA